MCVEKFQLHNRLRAAAMTGWKEPPWDTAIQETMIKHTLQAISDKMDGGIVDQIDEGQPFRTRLLSKMLRLAGDPDAEFMLHVGEGVSLGIDDDLPRTPLVFREKLKWNLPEWPEAPQACETNYKSAIDAEVAVRAKFEEEARLGRVFGPCTKSAAALHCGCTEDELVVGKLGCINGERTIHDATAPHVNHAISSQRPS